MAYTLLNVPGKSNASTVTQRRRKMLETIAILLIILWLLGLVIFLGGQSAWLSLTLGPALLWMAWPAERFDMLTSGSPRCTIL